MSPDLNRILNDVPEPSWQEFQQIVQRLSMEEMDEYLRVKIADSKWRRFVTQERSRLREKLDASESSNRHKEAIQESRNSNKLSRLAFAVSLIALIISIAGLYFQWQDFNRRVTYPVAGDTTNSINSKIATGFIKTNSSTVSEDRQISDTINLNNSITNEHVPARSQ